MVNYFPRGDGDGGVIPNGEFPVAIFRWTQEHKNHREDATVYPGSGQSVPYVQQLMILILKSI
jgi:hypothetical protein